MYLKSDLHLGWCGKHKNAALHSHTLTNMATPSFLEPVNMLHTHLNTLLRFRTLQWEVIRVYPGGN